MSKYLWDPAAYRASFVKKDGVWRMIYFIGGD